MITRHKPHAGITNLQFRPNQPETRLLTVENRSTAGGTPDRILLRACWALLAALRVAAAGLAVREVERPQKG
jgi:hypothetical protein